MWNCAPSIRRFRISQLCTLHNGHSGWHIGNRFENIFYQRHRYSCRNILSHFHLFTPRFCCCSDSIKYDLDICSRFIWIENQPHKLHNHPICVCLCAFEIGNQRLQKDDDSDPDGRFRSCFSFLFFSFNEQIFEHLAGKLSNCFNYWGSFGLSKSENAKGIIGTWTNIK